MIQHSDDITELSKALHAAQGAMSGVVRDSKNPHFKNTYASLEAVIDTARPALQAHGLAFLQAPGGLVDGAIEITTMLTHVSGQWMRSTLHVPLSKRDPQGVGSALTYGQRYSLMAMLGLPPVDDDGEAARAPEPRRAEAAPEAAQSRGGAVGPTKFAQEIAALIRECSYPSDLERVKAGPRFKRFWEISDEADKRFVSEAASAWKMRHGVPEAA